MTAIVSRIVAMSTLRRRRAFPWPADCSQLAALPASAEEPIATVRFEPRHAHAGGHVETLQHLARLRIDASHVALVGFPGAVPELPVHPRHAGDETVRLDGAKDRSSLRIDLMNLPIPMVPDP